MACAGARIRPVEPRALEDHADIAEQLAQPALALGPPECQWYAPGRPHTHAAPGRTPVVSQRPLVLGDPLVSLRASKPCVARPPRRRGGARTCLLYTSPSPRD